MENNYILSVRNLDITFQTSAGNVHAIRNVSFDLPSGKTLALVGESGSGKTVTMKAVVGLLDANAKITAGQIFYRAGDKSIDLLTLSKKELRAKINGQQIAMVFQDPMTSLDPTMRIGSQITEAMLLHRKITTEQAKQKTIELLKLVGLPEAEKRARNYPHQLSGGQRQRVGIAIALSCEPRILICDEPTTALDVTIQARILDLIQSLQKDLGLSVIYITHDLGVVAKVADVVNVMYAGKIIEAGTVEDIFYDPRHPYTWGLLTAMPDIMSEERRLVSIPGSPPNLLKEPLGDAFAARNKLALKIDERAEPPMFRISDTHRAATWLLHPSAPKVMPPPELQERLTRARKAAKVE